MARKKLDPAALAQQFGMTREEVKVAPVPKPKPEEQPKKQPGASAKEADVASKALDKPQEGELAIFMNLDKIHKHPKNRRVRGEDKIIELAMNIHEVGLLEYPLAWVNPQGECEILSGHHRLEAYIWLRDNVDAEKYAEIPIRFREGVDSEAEALRILHSANFYNSSLLPSERAESAAFIYDDVDVMRKEDESFAGGRAADIAAETLQMNARTVSRLVRIHRGLNADLKALWDAGIITQMQAEELTKLGFTHQETFYELAKDSAGVLSKKQFEGLRSKAVGVDLDKKKSSRNRNPNVQLRSYVKGFIKNARKAKEWRDKGATLDQVLIDELKEVVKMLEE